MHTSGMGSYQNYSTNSLCDPPHESTRASQNFHFNYNYNGYLGPKKPVPFYKRLNVQIGFMFLGIVAVCGISVIYITLSNNNFNGELRSLIVQINSNMQKDQEVMSVFRSALNTITKTTKEQQELTYSLNFAAHEITETAKKQDRAIDQLRSVVKANHDLLGDIVISDCNVQTRMLMACLPFIMIILNYIIFYFVRNYSNRAAQ